jgi:hypothetical protein
MITPPTAKTFDHDAISTTERVWRRHNAIGNPVDVHTGVMLIEVHAAVYSHART